MRKTTQLLCEHFPNNLAPLIESYIMEEGFPADMATAGHWELVSEFKDFELDSALYGACRGDSIQLVRHVISLGAKDYSFGLLGACCSNREVNREAGELMFSLGAEAKTYEYSDAVARFSNSMHMVTWLAKHKELNDIDFESILRGSAFTGNMSLVNFAIHNGANNWKMMFFDACRGGDHGMILLGLVNGGIPSLGLAAACSGGQMHVIRWMMRLGAVNYDHGLINAAMENHIDVVSYMIKIITQNGNTLDATVLNNVFSIAFHNSHFTIACILLTHGAKRCTHSHYCTHPWIDHITSLQSKDTLLAFNRAPHI